ncbi:MAG: glycosyltransferase family 4 protein [Phycisphaerales bacterium]
MTQKTLALLGKNAQHVLAFRGSLIRAAQANGHRVIALTSPASARARHRLHEAGVEHFDTPLRGGTISPLRDLQFQTTVSDILKAQRVDALLAYNPKCIAFGPIAARRAGVKNVAALVTGLGFAFTGQSLARRCIRFFSTRLYKRSLAACDAVFFQNATDREELTALGVLANVPNARVHMIAGSGVDLDFFAAQPVPTQTHFLMISRPLKDKGVAEFAQACKIVRASNPAIRCTLICAWDDNPSSFTRADIARWEQEGCFNVVDEVEDVRPHLGECTTFVLPSYREGTSKVVLEAMATGRAIISTDAIGCRDPIQLNVNGLLVATHSASELAAAMLELAHDPARNAAMGAESRRIAQEKYNATPIDAAILRALNL